MPKFGLFWQVSNSTNELSVHKPSIPGYSGPSSGSGSPGIISTGIFKGKGWGLGTAGPQWGEGSKPPQEDRMWGFEV